MQLTQATTIESGAQVRRPNAVERASWGWIDAVALGLISLIALVIFFVKPTYPSYDGYYSLVWAHEIAHGMLPSFQAAAAPTEHPLGLALSLLALPFGDAADRVFVLFAVIAYVGLVAGVYALAARCFSRPVGVIAGLIVLTRFDLIALASRGFIDIEFLALIVWAGAQEVRAPRRRWSVYVLLALAGLFRPEAWLFAGFYWLYRFPLATWPQRVRQAALVAAAPLIWLSLDLIVTGHPFFSLTSTRHLAGELGRNDSFFHVLTDTPHLLAKTVKLSVLLAGLSGIGYGLFAYWQRMRVPLALAAVGLGTFLTTTALGLSVNVRYLSIPSVIICLGAAVAVAGWTAASGRKRQIGVALAILAAALMVLRIPSYHKDASNLQKTVTFVHRQHDQLANVLQRDGVEQALKSCGRITVPSHQNVPIVRFMLKAGRNAVQPATFQKHPPRTGLMLLANDPHFKVKSGPGGQVSWWANLPLRGFTQFQSNRSWRLLQANCVAPAKRAAG